MIGDVACLERNAYGSSDVAYLFWTFFLNYHFIFMYPPGPFHRNCIYIFNPKMSKETKHHLNYKDTPQVFTSQLLAP